MPDFVFKWAKGMGQELAGLTAQLFHEEVCQVNTQHLENAHTALASRPSRLDSLLFTRVNRKWTRLSAFGGGSCTECLPMTK